MNVEQAAALRAQFPPSAVGKLPKAGTQLDYVGHAAVTDRLLAVDPAWVWEPVAFTDTGEPLIVNHGKRLTLWIKLTVCGVTRLGVGTCSPTAFEPEKELIGDALRNSAMRFGVALDLWSREELESQHSEPEPEVSWWVGLGWNTAKEHNDSTAELARRSKALAPAAAAELKAWLTEQGIDTRKVSLAEYDKWAEALEEMEQAG